MFKPRLTYKEFVAVLKYGIENALDDYENGTVYVNGDKIELEGLGQKIRFAKWNKDNTFIEFSLNSTEYNYLVMRIAEEVYETLIA